MKKKMLYTAITSILFTTSIGTSFAQSTDPLIEEITVTGSRVPGRSAEDLPVPVDVLTSEALSRTGHTEVGRMLQSIAPSFNFSSSSISDGTDALRPATLRGLGPDQTLVLINGKRRHQSSLIHNNTSVGRGTAGVDMNAIPAAAIKRIEVLRDGAAAQYGSDAIAGVINIVLNDNRDSGNISISSGEYTEGDGQTTDISLSKGFALGDTGFLNLTLNHRDRDSTNRAGVHGECLYSGCVRQLDSGGNPTVDPFGNEILIATDPREATANRNTFRIGDADSEQLAMSLNTGFQLGDGEVYGFVNYSSRDNQSGAFFRHPGNTSGNAPLSDGEATIIDGFLPKINSEIDDLSFNIGYEVEFNNGATLDISYTDGENTIDFATSDSLNSSFANELLMGRGLSDTDIRSSVPRSAFAYGLELGLETLNLDYTQNFNQLFVAIGAEIRTDEYKIVPGEEYAYRDYDTANGVSLYASDRQGGIQGFPGIGPDSAVDESRDVFSFYVDTEYSVNENLLVSGAVRYDDYDGFGDTTNLKLAANWSLTDTFRIRGAVSTGFRAPSMQQLYFNNISTQFDGAGNVQVVGTFRNDSSVAQAIGIPSLKEEESDNLSAGFIFNPNNPFSLTVDFYTIDIDDRIVISNKLRPSDDPVSPTTGPLASALIAAGAGRAQFFLNGANTETKGVDIVAIYSEIELFNGNLDLTFAANFTETDVTDLFTNQAGALAQVDPSVVFSAQDVSIIEEWQPKDRINLTGNYSSGNWLASLSVNRYGEYTTTESSGRQTFDAQWLTDAKVSYLFDNGLKAFISGNNIFDVTPDRNLFGQS